MRGASGEMRESRAKAQRRRKQSVSSVAVRRRTQKNTLRRATYEHAGLLPISLRLGALAPWREISSSCSAAPREPIASSACAQKRAPGKVESQGGKGHQPFPGAIGRRNLVVAPFERPMLASTRAFDPALRRSNTASGIPLEQCRAAPPALIHWAAKRTVSILAFGWRLVRPDPAVPAGRAGRHRVYVDQPAFLLEPAWR